MRSASRRWAAHVIDDRHQDFDLDRLLNIGLRVTTLTTRFAFIFVLAKFVDPTLVGYYGLFTVSIGYALYLVGLDFYTYATREIIRASAWERGPMIKGQMALSGGLYIVVLLTSLVILGMADWPGHLYWWFAPILLLEYVNQEISRLLIALSQQLTASLVLFLRQGSWAIVIVALFAFVPESRNLELVFALWTASGVAAAGLGAWKLSRLEIAGWRPPVNWRWVRRGIAVSMSFLVATLALRGIQTFDRYWLEHLGGVELVAAYVLFIGMAGSLLVFLDAGIFAFTYPELIRLHLEDARAQARAVVRRALWQTILCIAAFGAVSWYLLPHLLHWIGNPLYEREIGIYPWVLAAGGQQRHISLAHRLHGLGAGPGDWLWTSPVTFVASANCALYCGAQVDFVDIDPRTYNLCPQALERKLQWHSNKASLA
jgi:O-antigen/teichoic acid export membrane protein